MYFIGYLYKTSHLDLRASLQSASTLSAALEGFLKSSPNEADDQTCTRAERNSCRLFWSVTTISLFNLHLHCSFLAAQPIRFTETGNLDFTTLMPIEYKSWAKAKFQHIIPF